MVNLKLNNVMRGEEIKYRRVCNFCRKEVDILYGYGSYCEPMWLCVDHEIDISPLLVKYGKAKVRDYYEYVDSKLCRTCHKELEVSRNLGFVPHNKRYCNNCRR